jgi:predicted site-specific integrase-resolvase
MARMLNPLTTTEVAAAVGRSPRTVKRWCRDGRIAVVGKLAGQTGAWLIGAEGLEQARALAFEEDAA